VSDTLTKDDRILVDGEPVVVVSAEAVDGGFECVVRSATRGLFDHFVAANELASVKVAVGEAGPPGPAARSREHQ
jgi:hypothetical protein